MPWIHFAFTHTLLEPAFGQAEQVSDARWNEKTQMELKEIGGGGGGHGAECGYACQTLVMLSHPHYSTLRARTHPSSSLCFLALLEVAGLFWERRTYRQNKSTLSVSEAFEQQFWSEKGKGLTVEASPQTAQRSTPADSGARFGDAVGRRQLPNMCRVRVHLRHAVPVYSLALFASSARRFV